MSVCGVLVDALIYYLRLEYPTLFDRILITYLDSLQLSGYMKTGISKLHSAVTTAPYSSLRLFVSIALDLVFTFITNFTFVRKVKVNLKMLLVIAILIMLHSIFIGTH